MKIITTLVVVFIVAFVLVSQKQPKVPGAPSVVADITPTVNPKAVHPLSIENLRSRQFSSPSLKVERQVTSNSQVVSYLSDNLKLYALMITPKGDAPVGGWPVVIVNHGHIEPNIYSVTRSYINTSNYFASQGFLVLKPDYRGHDQSGGASSGRLLSRSEYAVDALNLLAAIPSISNANPRKIFLYGHSMGGDVSLQILEVSDKITAATLWAPATTTFPEQVTHFMNRRRPTPSEVNNFQSQYNEFVKTFPISQISAIDHLDLISAPLNLHHSTTDESVPYSWGVAINDKLKLLGKVTNFYSYSGDNHDISGHFSQALSRDASFFKSFL
jgi:dipeptidyl aminopeptidase/acylaminoacyl peptidase